MNGLRRFVTPAVLGATAIGVAGCALFGGSNSSSSGTVTADYMQSGTYDKAARAEAAAFAKHSDRASKVKVVAFPYAQLRQRNTTDLVSGTCKTDVMSGSYYLAPVYNHFQPLTRFIQRDHYGAGIVPGIWKASEFNDGQRIGIPYGSDAYSIMYRKDLFRQAGLEPPHTWPQFLAALRTLRQRFAARGIVPFVFAGGAPEQAPALFFASYDGYFVTSSGHYGLDPAKATAAIQFAKELLSYAPRNVNGLSIDQANEQFMQGKAATMYGWPSFIGKQASDPSTSKVAGKWAVAPDPGPGLTWLSLWQLYMPKCTKNADAAWQWMKYFSDPSNDKANFEKYGIGPVYTSTFNDPQIHQRYGDWFDGVEHNLQNAKNPPLSGEAQDYLASTLGQVFTGSLAPAQAVQQINRRWQGLSVPAPLKESAARNGFTER